MQHLLCIWLVCIGLPIGLATCIVIRQNALTFMYLVLLYCSPFVPPPNRNSMKGFTGWFLKICISVSLLSVMVQLSFQIISMLFSPSWNIYENCGFWEQLLWQVGLVQVVNLKWAAVKWVLPDFAMLMFSNVVFHLCQNMVKNEEASGASEESSLSIPISNPATDKLVEKRAIYLSQAGKFFTLFFMGVVSLLQPSLISSVYFFLFLGCCLWWSCNYKVKRLFCWICRFGMVYAAGHMTILFAYQFQFISDSIPESSLLARLLGLKRLLAATCKDPSSFSFTNAKWETFILPPLIMALYIFLSMCSHEMLVRDTDGKELAEEDINVLENEAQLAAEMRTGTTIKSKFHSLILPILAAAGYLFTSVSYLGTNIAMMVWSITFHSWLTFLLLVMSCIMFMVPDKRSIMMRMSPYLVVYVTFFMVTAYIYNLELTNDELPITVKGVNMSQFGLIRYKDHPGSPLFLQIMYCSMFWLTFHERCKENDLKRIKVTEENLAKMSKKKSIVDKVVFSKSAEFKETMAKWSMDMEVRLTRFLTKAWIWIVALVLCIIGLGGEKVSVYRIVYTTLFLIFIITFQISYAVWAAIMYFFWIIVILYSFIVLVAIYTYQFEYFPHFWSDVLGISIRLQHDIGLHVFDTGTLFMQLLQPTIFVILAVIQLQYFHEGFLMIYDSLRLRKIHLQHQVSLKSESLSECEKVSEGSSPKEILIMAQAFVWRFLEIHLLDIVFFFIMVNATNNVCVLHMIYVVMLCLALPGATFAKQATACLCSIFSAIILLVKMIYQLDSIHSYTWTHLGISFLQPFKNNGSDEMISHDNRVYSRSENTTLVQWAGFQRTSNLPSYVQGYIVVLVLLTLNMVVQMHQYFARLKLQTSPLVPGTYFYGIQCSALNKGIPQCLMYFANYAFYRFGVEVNLVVLVTLIAKRVDIISVFYSFWLACMFLMKRHVLAKIWPMFMLFVAVIIPIEYALCIGLPPSFCHLYPWYFKPELLTWFYLPDCKVVPDPTKIVGDLILLMVACHQQAVFRLESSPQGKKYPGGSNQEIKRDTCRPWDNPVQDFITYRRSWMDVVKKALFMSHYWTTLAIVYLSGTRRVNFFALGYLVASFVFLWKGTDFYLMPRKKVQKWWNYLLSYNVLVIFMKSWLQLFGCVYLHILQNKFCWLIQFFGISCLLDVTTLTSFNLKEIVSKTCELPDHNSGMFWDSTCFTFVLLSRRIINSYYIFHVVEEAKAEAMFATRGAIIYEELVQNSMMEEQEIERKIINKLKEKMEKLKSKHRRHILADRLPTHFDAIRSGDYYMFDEEEDESAEFFIDETSVPLEIISVPGYDIGELLRAAVKTNMKHAVELAKESRKRVCSHKRRKMSTHGMWSKWSLQLLVPVAMYETAQEEMKKYDETYLESKLKDSTHSTKSTSSFGEDVHVFILFVREFILSFVIGSTNWLFTFSSSYRYVSRLLLEEVRKWKQKRSNLNTIVEMAESRQKQREVQIKIELGTASPVLDSQQAMPFKNLSSSDKEPETLRSFSEPQFHKTHAASTSSERSEKKNLSAKSSTNLQKLSDDQCVLEPDPELKREKHIIVYLMKALWFTAMSQSELICYVLIFINHIKSANLLSLPLPIMVFLWGSFSVPRPGRTFWIAIVTYIELIVIFKCLLKFNFFPRSMLELLALHYNPNQKIITQDLWETDYDLLLLIGVFIHRHILKSLGQWEEKSTNFDLCDYIENESCTIQGSNEAILPFPQERRLSSAVSGADSTNRRPNAALKTTYQGPFAVTVILLKSIATHLAEVGPRIVKKAEQAMNTVQLFFHQLLYPPLKSGADVYALMFFCDFINFLIIIFGFSSFGGQGGVKSYIEQNRVPFYFLLILVMQFCLMLIDRALYLRKFILGKLVFQIVTIIAVHGYLFFMLPILTGKNFRTEWAPQMWYFVKCVYLLLSAFQIRVGYPTRILGNFICKQYSIVHMVLFKCFMLIPLLFEMRVLMDWIMTDTSMSLFDWLKLEDIFANAFQMKCFRIFEHNYPQFVGEKKNVLSKFFMGGVLLSILIGIIWLPLALFTVGTSVAITTTPVNVLIQLSFKGFQPFFWMDVHKEGIYGLPSDKWHSYKKHYEKNDVARELLSKFDNNDVVVVSLSGHATATWSISPPALQNLKMLVESDDPLDLKVTWKIYRNVSNTQVPGEVRNENEVSIPAYINGYERNPQRILFAKILSNESKEPVSIKNIFPRFLKVTQDGMAVPIINLNSVGTNRAFASILLFLHGNEAKGNLWWEVQEDCAEYNPKKDIDDCGKLDMCTFNEKTYPPHQFDFISRRGIIGIYTTFVLFISNYVRRIFFNISPTIMYLDLPNVDRILQLCLDIYLVRESGDFLLEEDLFAKLLFLYRTPETLIRWTRDNIWLPPQ